MRRRVAGHYLPSEYIDLVSTRRASRDISHLLAARTEALNPEQPSYGLQLSRLKSRIARQIRAGRARAMLGAADVPPGTTPAWMLSARVPVGAWILWTKCLSQVVQSAWSDQDDALTGGRLQVHATAGSRTMTLRGSIYAGTLSPASSTSVLSRSAATSTSRAHASSSNIRHCRRPFSPASVIRTIGAIAGDIWATSSITRSPQHTILPLRTSPTCMAPSRSRWSPVMRHWRRFPWQPCG